MLILTLLFGFTTVIGIILTIYYGRKSSALQKQKKKLEWADLQSCAHDLAAKVSKDFNVDVILTTGLRGATIVNLLKDKIDNKIPVYVGMCFWKEYGNQFISPKNYFLIETNKWFVFYQESIFDHIDKKILIVDDFAMSGDFLDKLVTHLEENGFPKSNIKTLSVVTTTIAIKNHKAPDFYWMEAQDTNFYFPWGKAK